mmetsp:Transcript_16537/g.38161  ORF Transcript_16537/g.38161 Transcript_16537/m.38161 type:complete len:179 (+) Transcript_16537:56-592(+)
MDRSTKKRMKKPAWRHWDGNEVATFLEVHCGLPEYSLTAERNLSGAVLHELEQWGQLTKGLSRAGIINRADQGRIVEELRSLRKEVPESLTKDLAARRPAEFAHSRARAGMTRSTGALPPLGEPKGVLRSLRFDFRGGAAPVGPWRTEVQNTMQRSVSVGQVEIHRMGKRLTPDLQTA